VKVFGILGILIGPMYSIIAKEIIYDTEWFVQFRVNTL
jgi:predicted PurR-regulated permease PerM